MKFSLILPNTLSTIIKAFNENIENIDSLFLYKMMSFLIEFSADSDDVEKLQ